MAQNPLSKNTVVLAGLTPPIPGGSMWHILDIARRLKTYKPILLTQKGTQAQQEGIECITVPYKQHKSTYIRNLSFFIASIPKLKAVMKDHQIIHFHENFFFPLIPYFKKRKKTIIVTLHGFRGFAYYDKKFLWKHFRRWIQQADQVIAVSADDKKILEKEFPGKVTYIPNGVDIKQFPRSKQKGKNILFIGRVHPQKGVHILLEAFKHIQKEFPNEKLVIAGPAEGAYAEECKKNASKNVTFIGKYPREQLPKLFKEAKMIVLPSLWEGMALTLTEALASEKPIIVSNLPSMASLVKSGKNGILVEPNNVEELTKAIKFVLTHKKEAEKMGKAGRKTAEAYDWAKISLKTEQVYKKNAK